MKVVHVISGLNTGGAEMMLLKLISVWDRNSYQIEVISLTDVGIIGNRIRRLNIPVRALGMRRGRPAISGWVCLARWLRQSAPNLVQTWMYHSDLVGGLAAKLAGRIPVVWGIRNSTLDSEHSKRSTIWTVKTCAKLSRWLPRKIICCSEVARQVHERLRYCSTKLVVIPNGFDLSAFKPDEEARSSVRRELGISSQTLLIGLIARFDPQKDHQNFIEAARRLAAQPGDVRFLLVGDRIDSGNKVLLAWIETARLKHRFHLLGRREDIPRITASLDVASLASSYGEAFPNVLGEAMASCVPCVATDVGDSALIIGDTGKVVPPKDPQRLAEALNEMVELGAEGRSQLGLRARRRIHENFDLPVIRDRYEALYGEVADA